MKHTIQKSLAVLLAMLMLLGVTATGAAAAPIKKADISAQANNVEADGELDGTVTVTTPGKAEAALYHYWEGDPDYYVGNLDLSGLVLSASGGKLSAAQTIDYDTAMKGNLQGDNIDWSFSLDLDWDKQPDGWKLGANQAVLYVYGDQYSGFELVEGIYGEFKKTELCFEGQMPITITGVEAQFTRDPDFDSAEELTLGVSKDVSIPESALVQGNNGEYYEEPEQKFFSFTPAASGSYVFRSAGAKSSRTLYTEDGEVHHFSGVDPVAILYDANGYQLRYNDDNQSDENHPLNFAIYHTLKAGRTYYLSVSTYGYGGGDYTMRVDTSTKKLVVPKTEITIKYGEYVAIKDLVKGTTWDIGELGYYEWDWLLDYHWNWDSGIEYLESISGREIGTTYLEIHAPDGEWIEIKVTVKPTFGYLFRYYVLGGWRTGMENKGFWQTVGGLMWSILSIPMLPFFPLFWLAKKLMDR